MRQFVSKKIVELLGETEEDLVQFVVEAVANKSPPEELVQELEGVSSCFRIIFFFY
jgi:hypothetical protein